ncbi:hypothetical protein PENTCL1PPCAC_20012 [Pristionchus entomophagus]|uniref:Uncharacterized protein n=1 Tax=Pristionchus entomophagus TaxID=358040 RepID=A0AAV5TUD7_9BILA|nr:hypothetical protein PENTCL1PPCAC_20012 [Pristionchus entomophagus]
MAETSLLSEDLAIFFTVWFWLSITKEEEGIQIHSRSDVSEGIILKRVASKTEPYSEEIEIDSVIDIGPIAERPKGERYVKTSRVKKAKMDNLSDELKETNQQIEELLKDMKKENRGSTHSDIHTKLDDCMSKVPSRFIDDFKLDVYSALTSLARKYCDPVPSPFQSFPPHLPPQNHFPFPYPSYPLAPPQSYLMQPHNSYTMPPAHQTQPQNQQLQCPTSDITNPYQLLP